MARRKDYAPRTDGPGSGRRARGPAHRVRERVGWPIPDVPDVGRLNVWTETCRCGAWRAHVRLHGRLLVTDWSAPCSAPSPAPARDDA